MIFEECEQGLKVYIPHKEMMCNDEFRFIFTIMKGKRIYRDNHADLDDDHSDGE